jgi:hypothetical protein
MATQTFPLNFNRLLAKVVGSSNDREVKRLRPRIELVNSYEPRVRLLSDEELAGTAADFRARLARTLGESPADASRDLAKRGSLLDEALDELLPEMFARVREASRRVVGMRHFDVQLIGGMVLHSGRITEMRTGEGKTLGRGQDARRDARREPERARRPRRARRDDERLPRAPRRGVDGPDLQGARIYRRRAAARHG